MNIVLSSTVVATVIAGLLSVMSTRRQDKLKYITAERKEWRAEIRHCTERIRSAEDQELVEILEAIKVRLNAYGMFGNEYMLQVDAHIWQLIKDIEEQEHTVQEIIDKKDLLVKYLTLLLKTDWERAKAEVSIDWHKIISALSLVASYAIFLFIIFECGAIENESPDALWMIGVILVFFLFIPYWALSAPTYKMIYELVFTRFNARKKKTWPFTMGKVLMVVFGLLYWYLCFITVQETLRLFNNWTNKKEEIILSVIIFMVLSEITLIFKYIDYWKKMDEKKKYFDYVIKCEKDKP